MAGPVARRARGRLSLPFFPLTDAVEIWDHVGVRFELLGPIVQVETFAVGARIREIARLLKFYGKGRWRKRKGLARVRLSDGSVHLAEIHWYESTGIGRKEHKIKRLL
jgi:hypothetical protein